MLSLDQWSFDNSYSQLPGAFFTRQQPTALANPHLISANLEVAALLELDPRQTDSPAFLACFSGQQPLAAMAPLAMKYAGHQFGHYNPALGDGRGLLLGELETSQGLRWDLHLKGAGQTPYSRQGDGRAVLRSSIREYLCGEAMAGLGIATTRTLCLIGSDEPVWRETLETAATTVRVAPSHVRFGHFEHFFYNRQPHYLKTLADHLIKQHYPELHGEPSPYLALFTRIVTTTARLIAQWQAVGFAHGVMNTDNMSVLGLTLDYGPYGFMDNYHSDFTPNHSDHTGRYAFDQQAQIGLWNLSALGNSWTPLVEPDAINEALQHYPRYLKQEYLALMRQKLGLQQHHQHDGQLINQLLGLMADNHPDYTIFFRSLADFDVNADNGALRQLLGDHHGLDPWASQYRQRLRLEKRHARQRSQAMNAVNPKFILRNYLAQQAIARAQAGDYGELETLLHLLKHPFDEQPSRQVYADPPPDWGKGVAISCSS